MTALLNNLWLICLVVSIVLKGLPGTFPNAAHSLSDLSEIALNLAFLFANPTGAMAALKGATTTRWSGPTEVKHD